MLICWPRVGQHQLARLLGAAGEVIILSIGLRLDLDTVSPVLLMRSRTPSAQWQPSTVICTEESTIFDFYGEALFTTSAFLTV